MSDPDFSELVKIDCPQGSFRFRVKGCSMQPFVRNGDLAMISPLSISAIGQGDIVAFIHPGVERLVIHRVVGKKFNRYLIKADTAFGIDGLIAKENIIGIVVGIERAGGKIAFGLGPERYIIAFLSRYKILFLLSYIRRKIVKRR